VVTGGGHVSFEMGVNILLTSRTSGSRKKGAQRPNNSSREVVKLRGAATAVGSRMRMTVGSEPHARIAHSEDRRLSGPRLDCRSREVPRAEARVWTRGRTPRWGPRG
jgi:hypothetical protein